MTPSSLTLFFLALLEACVMPSKDRALAVGGVHALDGAGPCHLSQVEPASASEDLHWKDALVVRAHSEGHAELACGSERTRLRLVTPGRIELVLVDDHVVAAGQRFHVRAIPLDPAGHDLELGKWTEIAWRVEGSATPGEDASAGEYGLGGGSFGVYGFKARKPGDVTISAQLGTAVGTLRLVVSP